MSYGVINLLRINAENTGQFERTLIIADNNAYELPRVVPRHKGMKASCTLRLWS